MKVAYFAGAGLSRSLALPGKPVPSMFDYIQVMAEHLSPDEPIIVTALAQLEEADPYPYGSVSPATQAAAAYLLDKPGKPRELTEARVDAFKAALKARPSESLEDMLRRLQTPKNLQADSVLTRFEYAIARVFCRIGWDVDFSALDTFLNRQFGLRGQHSFVSFNYDILLEHRIHQQPNSRWNPFVDYGFSIPYYLETDPREVPGPHPAVAHAGLYPGVASAEFVRVIKPHGSLNWLVERATTPDTPRDDTLLVLPITGTGQPRYFCSTATFPIVDLPDRMPSVVGPLILPPADAKHRFGRTFTDLSRDLERDAVIAADEVFVLGWSMPKTDVDQEKLIHDAVRNRASDLQRLTVVTKGETDEHFSRVRDVFRVPAARVNRYNDGFAAFVETL